MGNHQKRKKTGVYIALPVKVKPAYICMQVLTHKDFAKDFVKLTICSDIW